MKGIYTVGELEAPLLPVTLNILATIINRDLSDSSIGRDWFNIFIKMTGVLLTNNKTVSGIMKRKQLDFDYGTSNNNGLVVFCYMSSFLILTYYLINFTVI